MRYRFHEKSEQMSWNVIETEETGASIYVRATRPAYTYPQLL